VSRVRRAAIRAGVIRTAALDVGRTIQFHDVARSNLLTALACGTVHEPELVRWLSRYPWPTNRFIDGGANVGLMTVAASMHTGAEVVAVEPHPANAAYLREVVQRNTLTNVQVVEAALGEGTGSASLAWPETSSRLPATATTVASHASSINVQAVGLTDLVTEQTVVKLDCEGAELSILRAACGAIDRYGPDVIVEIMIDDADRQETWDLLVGLGYQGWLLTTRGLVLEDRPLTLPHPVWANRTAWRNHWFTRRPADEVRAASTEVFGRTL
jgi:FkbM family methyltransferase